MAMPSGNSAVSAEKMQFPVNGSGNPPPAAVAVVQPHQHQQQHWYPDERDGFISWLRGEFAAANAIIDSLCHHLRAVGEQGEYDAVIGAIQQRRCNWNPVLHMQQYFSVAEVIYALQQASWRHQPQPPPPPPQQHQPRFYDPGPKKEYRRSGGPAGFKQTGYVRAESFGSSNNAGLERGGRGSDKFDDNPDGRKDSVVKTQEDGSLKSSEISEGASEIEVSAVDDGCTSSSKENDSQSATNQNLANVPKTFYGSEMFDGKPMNVVEGLKLYQDFNSDAEVSKLLALVNDMRSAGKRGQFQGQTYVVSKRPMKGHGREMIQLGLPIADAPFEEENPSVTSKDQRLEVIPPLLQDVVESLLSTQITTVKPDSCIIDFYNEGDHSQPQMWPPWFGKPVCVLFLTECEITFGRVITTDHPGDYRGALRLPLKPGSLLAMQGKSADFAKYAIPSVRKQRILVTFTKSQPKKSTPIGLPQSGMAPPPYWGPPPSRSPNHHMRHPVPKHYAPVPSTGVLPAPPTRPQIPPNGIQPLFVTAPVSPVMTFPSPVPAPAGSSGWAPAAPPRHPPPRLPVPGTGVFLPPPGSGGNSSSPLPGAASNETSQVAESPASPVENGPGKTNLDVKTPKQECNGSTEGQGNGGVSESEEEKHQSSDNTATSKSAASV